MHAESRDQPDDVPAVGMREGAIVLLAVSDRFLAGIWWRALIGGCRTRQQLQRVPERLRVKSRAVSPFREAIHDLFARVIPGDACGTSLRSPCAAFNFCEPLRITTCLSRFRRW